MTKKWEKYEEVAAYLLNRFAEEFGLSRAEGKQKVKGDKTDWEIDAKGINEDGIGFVVVECRRYTTSRLPQKDMASLAFQIKDTDAKGGIVVSPLGLQVGAKKIAIAERIVEVKLDPSSTPESFAMQFLDKVMIYKSSSLQISAESKAQVGQPCSECGKQFFPEKNEGNCAECISGS